MFVKLLFVFVQITVCRLQPSQTLVTKNNNINTQIVFPGPVQDLGSRFGTPNDTDPCEGQTFCTVKPHDYPQDVFNNFFRGKYKATVFRPSYVLTDSRVGESEEVDNCEAKVTYEPLYKARSNLVSDWRMVAQAPEENFSQLIRIESCSKIGTSCFTKFKAPIDLEASCFQKYSVWEILVYDGKGGTEPMKVDLPSCCSCYYKTKD